MAEQKSNFTISEAARHVGVSRPIIYNAIYDGSLVAWKTWSRGSLRIRVEELNAWMHRKADVKQSTTETA